MTLYHQYLSALHLFFSAETRNPPLPLDESVDTPPLPD